MIGIFRARYVLAATRIGVKATNRHNRLNIQFVVCVAPPQDAQVVLEISRDRLFVIN
jgi:hypothetical protein